MATMNPMQLILMLKNGSPQQVAQQIIQTNFPNNPQMQQLLQLGQQGNKPKLEEIANQVFGAQGKNFADELNSLMQAVKHL